jgi:hypothetical protein
MLLARSCDYLICYRRQNVWRPIEINYRQALGAAGDVPLVQVADINCHLGWPGPTFTCGWATSPGW